MVLHKTWPNGVFYQVLYDFEVVSPKIKILDPLRSWVFFVILAIFGALRGRVETFWMAKLYISGIYTVRASIWMVTDFSTIGGSGDIYFLKSLGKLPKIHWFCKKSADVSEFLSFWDFSNIFLKFPWFSTFLWSFRSSGWFLRILERGVKISPPYVNTDQ